MRKSDKPDKEKEKGNKPKDESHEAHGYIKQSYDFVEELKKAGKEYSKEKESDLPAKKLESDNNPLLRKPSNDVRDTEHKAKMKMGNKEWRIGFSNIPEGDHKSVHEVQSAPPQSDKKGHTPGSKSREDYILGTMYPSPQVTIGGKEEPRSLDSQPPPGSEKRLEQTLEHKTARKRSLVGSPELDVRDLQEVDKLKAKHVVKLLMDAEDSRKQEEQVC